MEEGRASVSGRACVSPGYSPPARLLAGPSQTQTALSGFGWAQLPGGPFRRLDLARGTVCVCMCLFLYVSTIPASFSMTSPVSAHRIP